MCSISYEYVVMDWAELNTPPLSLSPAPMSQNRKKTLKRRRNKSYLLPAQTMPYCLWLLVPVLTSFGTIDIQICWQRLCCSWICRYSNIALGNAYVCSRYNQVFFQFCFIFFSKWDIQLANTLHNPIQIQIKKNIKYETNLQPPTWTVKYVSSKSNNRMYQWKPHRTFAGWWCRAYADDYRNNAQQRRCYFLSIVDQKSLCLVLAWLIIPIIRTGM